MDGVTLAFESKGPFHTPWLSIEFPVGQEPTELIEALAGIGWKENEQYARVPPLDGIQEVNIAPPKGSELFGTWSDEEARANMPVIRRLLRRHGFDRVPWNKLTLEDLL